MLGVLFFKRDYIYIHPDYAHVFTCIFNKMFVMTFQEIAYTNWWGFRCPNNAQMPCWLTPCWIHIYPIGRALILNLLRPLGIGVSVSPGLQNPCLLAAAFSAYEKINIPELEQFCLWHKAPKTAVFKSNYCVVCAAFPKVSLY